MFRGEARQLRQVRRASAVSCADNGEKSPCAAAGTPRSGPRSRRAAASRSHRRDARPASRSARRRRAIARWIFSRCSSAPGARRHLASGWRRQVPGAGAGRVDQHQVAAAFEIGEHILLCRAARAPAHCARRRAPGARRSASAAARRRHRRRSGRDCAFAPRAPASCRRRRRKDRAPARPARRPQSSAASCEPSSCSLDKALHKGGFRRERGAAPIGAGQMRRPSGDSGVGAGCKMRELGQRLLARAFENIDAQIERRAGGQRRALRRRVVAERDLQRSAEPFGIVAAHMRRARRRALAVSESLALLRRQRRGAHGRRRRTAPRWRRRRDRAPRAARQA